VRGETRDRHRFLLGSSNRGKLREIEPLLEGVPFELATLAEWPDVAAPEETGRTFAENARAKALYYAAHTGELTVAEDSGPRLATFNGVSAAPGQTQCAGCARDDVCDAAQDGGSLARARLRLDQVACLDQVA